MKITGRCSICGEIAKLTDDHVPPKCCGNSGVSYYTRFTAEFLASGPRYVKKKYSQNGIKFQTICAKCNNELGRKYDNDLAKFRDYIINSINGNKKPSNFNLSNVIMSIIGHLMAASKYEEALPTVKMREYYLGKNTKLLDEYSLFVCYYPFKENIFILKDYVPVSLIKSEKRLEGMLSSMYFYPFAFILASKQKPLIGNDLLELVKKPISFFFSLQDWIEKPPMWPAIIDDYHYVVASKASEDSVFK